MELRIFRISRNKDFEALLSTFEYMLIWSRYSTASHSRLCEKLWKHHIYIFLQSKNAVIASIGVSCVKAIAVTTKREGSLSYKEKGLFELLLSKWRVLPPLLFLSWLTQNWWSVMVQQRSSIHPTSAHWPSIFWVCKFILLSLKSYLVVGGLKLTFVSARWRQFLFIFCKVNKQLTKSK